MPALASLAAFTQAVADFPVSDPGLVPEPAARAAAERSAAESGLVLPGEVHGVRGNPLLIRALLQALGLTGLALEWDAELAPMVSAFLAGGALADHPALWSGDGRITAGHLAVLREHSAAGPLELTLMDGALPGGMGSADWSWSQRDEAMADRVLAAAAPGARTLVVAGSAHTPVHPTELGVPLGAGSGPARTPVRPARRGPGPPATGRPPLAPEAAFVARPSTDRLPAGNVAPVRPENQCGQRTRLPGE